MAVAAGVMGQGWPAPAKGLGLQRCVMVLLGDDGSGGEHCEDQQQLLLVKNHDFNQNFL
jgi:hypothetical protein